MNGALEPRPGPIAWMAQNPVAANLLMLTFLIGGVIVFRDVTQEVFPDLTTDVVTVDVAYPGASPAEVEQGIVLAVEEALRGLDGVYEIRGTAREGHGRVEAELLESAEPMKVYQDIQSEVDRVRTFPEDAEEPQVALAMRRRETLSLVLFGETSEQALRELAEQVRQRFLQHPKITQVDLEGVRPYEISVEVPQANLRRYGLTLGDVANRLAGAAVELPGGGVKAATGEILLRVQERRDFGRQFAQTAIIEAADGSRVLLEDMATVIDGFEDTDRFATYDGKPAVMLAIYRVGDQTPTELVRAAEELLAQIRPDLPQGTGLEILRNMADIFEQRARLLMRNGALGLCLVMLLLGLFLEIRLAFWVMMGIPISFLGALLFMPALDLSINMVTMFAFIVALGIVVDDAIVVGENVYHHHQEGKPLLRAAVDGAREVAVPVAFSILTNVVAFIPLYVLPGVMGKVLRMLPLIVISAFLISWAECLFVLPSHLGRHDEHPQRGFGAWLHVRQQRFSVAFRDWVRRRYGPFLRVCVTNRYLVLAVAIAVLALAVGYGKSGRMGFSLFPTVESDYARATAVLPYGVAVARTAAVADRMVKAAQEVVRETGHPELVTGIFADTGRQGAHTADVRVFLAPAEIRDKIMGTQAFTEAWRRKVGEVVGVKYIRFLSDSGGPGGGPALTVELRHDDVATLEDACRALATELEEFPLTRDVDDGVQRGKRQLDFEVKPAAGSLGLTARDIGLQIRHAFEGAEVLRQQRGRNEVKVKVRLTEAERTTEQGIEDLVLRTPAGGEVPLRDVVHVEAGRAYTTITRRNAQRALTVVADVRPKSKAGEVMRRLDAETMPRIIARHPGLSYSYEGHQAEGRKSFGSMATTIPLVLVAIYALLAVPFRSYIQPLIVMVSIPFGIVGALLGHLIMGYSMSMIGAIGIVALAGVVVNDALVLISFANRKRDELGNAYEAIVAAGVQRFRPIILTTLTTFGGLAPMIFETSRQARFLIPMALSLGYGLLFATLITLVLVPSLYMIVEDVRGAAGRRGRAG